MLHLKNIDVAPLLKKGNVAMTLITDLENIKNKIKNKISYNYIDQYTIENKISKIKLLSLILIMNESNLSQEIKENYITATMLVETALETHEQVRENEVIGDSYGKALTKQLSVLGGDYYSSLYYVLLSNVEDFSFTKNLATAIKEVNELKMNLHFKESEALEHHISLRKIIESHIIKSVAQYINVKDQSLFKIIDLTLMLDLLLREKTNFISTNKFNYFTNKRISTQLIKEIDKIIYQYNLELNTLISDSENELLHQFNMLFEEEKKKYLVYTEEG